MWILGGFGESCGESRQALPGNNFRACFPRPGAEKDLNFNHLAVLGGFVVQPFDAFQHVIAHMG